MFILEQSVLTLVRLEGSAELFKQCCLFDSGVSFDTGHLPGSSCKLPCALVGLTLCFLCSACSP